MTHLSELIKTLREKQGLTLQIVADEFEVTRQCVHRMERGLMKVPIKLLPTVARTFEVDIDILMKALKWDFEEECVAILKEAEPYQRL